MGVIVLDAGVVIAVLDANDVHHQAAREALSAALLDPAELVLPASAYAEVLVAPSRAGGTAVATVDAFVDGLPARIEPTSRTIAASAAALRARHGSALRLPDALIIATAVVLRAERVLTTNARWPRRDIRIEVLGTA